MIRDYIGESTRVTILNALFHAHKEKEVVWVDMDGVVADFVPKATEFADEMGLTFQQFVDQNKYREIENFYKELPIVPGAKQAIQMLEDSDRYELFFLSAPSWENVSCFSDKRMWVEANFPSFEKKMTLSHQKGYSMGHYLIDDRKKYGAKDFIGEHIMFGGEKYPDWKAVIDKLL